MDSLSLPVPSLVICEMLRFALLLVAGHETTANMISLSTVAFLRNPGQHAMIKADLGKTLNAVEEMLWYFTIIDVATARLCVEDIKVGGQLIRVGEGVLALGYSANRDLRAFENPDEFDIERGARHHVEFGAADRVRHAVRSRPRAGAGYRRAAVQGRREHQWPLPAPGDLVADELPSHHRKEGP